MSYSEDASQKLLPCESCALESSYIMSLSITVIMNFTGLYFSVIL